MVEVAYVYILQAEDGRYYIGSTDDISRRVSQHQKGYSPATKRMGKVKLVLQQEYDSISKARKIEFRLKKLKRRDYIDKVVSEGIIRMRP